MPLGSRLEALVSGWSALAWEPRLGVVVQRIADLARDVAKARYAAIGLLGPDRRTLELFVTSGMPDEDAARIGPRPTGRGILGVVIREAKPIRLTDLTQHHESAGFPPHHPPMRSFLGVPIVGRHGVVGNLYLTEKEGMDEFTAEDEHLAVLLAGMAAAAFENASHMEESDRLLTEVQDLMRSRERFFAMVNHELRNSLAAVLGWSEMLVRRKDPATVPKAAFEVLESAEAAVGLVSDLLDLSRLDEDRLRPVMAEVDCRPVLSSAVHRVSPSAASRRVSIRVEYARDLPVCVTDRHRVEQILVNVLTNAIRHAPEASEVLLTIAANDGRIRVCVADRGPGIPEDEFSRIFEVYHTKLSDGVGLGLPLSRRLARLLGGELQARHREGGGAEFLLELPVG